MSVRTASPALAAALLFGASTPLAKLLVGDVPALLLAGLLYLGSGIGLSILLALRWARERASGHAATQLGIPPKEVPWLLSAGAALGQLLLAARALGYGAIILSGERCHDELLRDALGLGTHETLAGFVSIGAIAKSPPPAKHPDRGGVISAWMQAAVLGQCTASSGARRVASVLQVQDGRQLRDSGKL